MVNGWVEKTIGTIGNFSKGRGISKAEAQSGSIPCIRYGEIYTNHNNYIKTFYSFISANVAATSRRLKKGELLFSGSGETKEEIGKCVAFISDFEAYAGGDIIILTPKTDIDSQFFGYYLNSSKIVKQRASRGQGDSIVHITPNSLSEIVIVFPFEVAEQRRIAAVLSDTDKLITALEKLIAKKRAIKQGTMQELLTGKRRLPGFSGEWAYTTIGTEFDLFAGGDLDRDHFSQSKTAVHKYGIFANALQDSGLYGYTSVPKYNGNSVTITGRGDVGVAMYRENDFDAIVRLLVLTPKKGAKVDSRFFCYFINQMVEFPLESTGVPQLTVPQIRNIEVNIPDKPEQTAIANILSDMDDEIDALTAKLNKYKRIKQGMMSELLTGRIRLLGDGEEVVP